MSILEYKNYLVNWLKECVEEANASGLVVGISGGIDSALVANLIKEATNDNYLGIIIPIETDNIDLIDAHELVTNCELNHIELTLDSVFNSFKNVYDYKKSNSLSNIKARIRMTQLYAIASEHNYLVVGTDNKCEWYTGFFTKYGDGGVDIAPLIHLNKSEVYEMAKLYNIPKSILEKKPSAGLGSNLTDEEEMGVKYETLDKFLRGESVDKNSTSIINKLHLQSEHKRVGIKFPNVDIER
ncbi:MAG: NAD(+) synthase [Bacilli bacterium]